MTPKEKAKELVKRMYAVHSNSASDITLYFDKQCALIAIEEIIKEHYPQDAERCQYWLEVKHEVSLL